MSDDLHLLQLREKIKSLSPSAQLRLAAELLDMGKLSLAESIAGSVVDELRLKQLLGRGKQERL